MSGALWVAVFCTLGIPVRVASGQELSRGPYLQQGTPTSMVIRWRTTEPSETRLAYGTSRDSLTMLAQSPTRTTEHKVELRGLRAQTRYYYRISASPKVLAGGDDDHYFVTSPRNADEPTRVWILGDAGSSGKLEAGNDPSQILVRDAFLKAVSPQGFNFIMMLGDNAYNTGTDVEYQRGFFDVYRSVLRSKVSWPTQGNHDASPQGYYEAYSLPTRGESGGRASGTEEYYSFDHGNAHFISLNSQNRDPSFRASMLKWLRRDLEATTKVWTTVFWHHPPYTKGHHDSDDLNDSGGRMAWMRQNVLPILERAGVDLVFSGHSHSYERSRCIDRHYGVAQDFSESSIVQPCDAREEKGGTYTKATLSKTPHSGTIYVVSGSAGSVQGGRFDHPAMVVSEATLGSVLLAIDGNEAVTTMIGADGKVVDSFTLRKDPARPRAVQNLIATVDEQSCHVVVSWNGAPTDSSYTIYRSTSVDARGSKVGRIKGGTSHFTDSTISSSTTPVWYSVRASSARGQGPWGSTAYLAGLPAHCVGLQRR